MLYIIWKFLLINYIPGPQTILLYFQTDNLDSPWEHLFLTVTTRKNDDFCLHTRCEFANNYFGDKSRLLLQFFNLRLSTSMVKLFFALNYGELEKTNRKPNVALKQQYSASKNKHANATQKWLYFLCFKKFLTIFGVLWN